MPDERLPTGQTVVLGLQHVVAMFGATVLAPILMGFDPERRDPLLRRRDADLLRSWSAGACRAISARASPSSARCSPRPARPSGSPNPNIGLALGGIIAAGALYFLDRRRRAGRRPPLGRAADAARGDRRHRRRDRARAGADRHRQRLGHRPDNPDGTGFARWIALAHGRRGRPRRGLRARPVAAPADPHRRRHRLLRLSDLRQRHGARQRRSISRRSAPAAWFGLPTFASAGLRRRRHQPDRAGRDHPGRREPRAHQGDRRHDRAQPRSAISAAPSSATASPRWCRARPAARASRPMPRTWASWR